MPSAFVTGLQSRFFSRLPNPPRPGSFAGGPSRKDALLFFEDTAYWLNPLPSSVWGFLIPFSRLYLLLLPSFRTSVAITSHLNGGPFTAILFVLGCRLFAGCGFFPSSPAKALKLILLFWNREDLSLIFSSLRGCTRLPISIDS